MDGWWGTDLPEDEAILDRITDGWVTPDIAIQNLTGKFLDILNVDHEPLVRSCATILGLVKQNTSMLIRGSEIIINIYTFTSNTIFKPLLPNAVLHVLYGPISCIFLSCKCIDTTVTPACPVFRKHLNIPEKASLCGIKGISVADPGGGGHPPPSKKLYLIIT